MELSFSNNSPPLFSDVAEIDLKVSLLFPDLAIDEYGNKGFWTLIYNQVKTPLNLSYYHRPINYGLATAV